MTEKEVRQFVVKTAEKYLGYKESNGSHKKIVDTYNNHKPLAAGYKVKYTDSWCATFVSFVSILCNYTDIMFLECSCPRMIELYKKAGRWQEKDSYVPSPADIIMYDWEDNGKGDNTGTPNHVGIVVSVDRNNNIKVIEGNKNDAVSYRTIKVNGKYIRGYCLPNYTSKATKTDFNIEIAEYYDKKLFGKYKTKADLNLRTGAGTSKEIVTTMNKNSEVFVTGCYNLYNNVKWYLCFYNKEKAMYGGYASSNYLKKI